MKYIEFYILSKATLLLRSKAEFKPEPKFTSLHTRLALLFSPPNQSYKGLVTADIHPSQWTGCLTSPPTQSSSVEVLTLNVMVLSGRAFRRWSGHEGGTLFSSIRSVLRGQKSSWFTLSAIWGHREKSAISNPERGVSRTRPLWPLILDSSDSGTMRNQLLLLIIFPVKDTSL